MGLTIFSIPKAFAGDSDRLQRNALSSWARLPDVEIVLMGDDDGVAAAADSVGASHVPGISRTDQGTPRLDVAFREARLGAKHSNLCYVNSDIILPGDFSTVIGSVRLERFLGVGGRWDLAVDEDLDLAAPGTDARLRAGAATLGPPFAIDYFVFPRDVDWQMPPFAVGRTVWDNWLIFRARELRLPVVDLTDRLYVIHQSHDYSHIGSTPTSLWKGPEAEENRRLAGLDRLFTIHDATHMLTAEGGLKRAAAPKYLRQRWLNRPLLSRRFRPLYRQLLRATRRVRGLDPAL